MVAPLLILGIIAAGIFMLSGGYTTVANITELLNNITTALLGIPGYAWIIIGIFVVIIMLRKTRRR